MVKIERGKTIFESSAQTLVNTINCVGVMGKGLALEFKNRYPAMFDKYKSFCDKGVFKPGVLWIYKAEDGKWVLNFPTKVDWKNPSELSYIEDGLKKFVEIWKEKGITSVAFPLLGCNNGGLDPDVVIPLMKKYLDQCEGLDVTIYDNRPQEAEAPKTDATSEFFGDENPKEVVVESKPLVDEEPPKPTEKIEIPDEAIIQRIEEINSEKEKFEQKFDSLNGGDKTMAVENENPEAESESKYGTKDEEEKGDTPETNEDMEILKEIVEERKALHNEVDKILEDFQKSDNSPEYRKKVAKRIVSVVNRRGFPQGSLFQI